MSDVVVGVDGADTVVKNSDLNRVAKRAATHLADLASEAGGQ